MEKRAKNLIVCSQMLIVLRMMEGMNKIDNGFKRLAKQL